MPRRLTAKIYRLLLITTVLVTSLVTSIYTYASATGLTARVDKNPVMLDESIQLIITATGDVENSDLDLSALDKDFKRSRTSISRSTQSINFKTSKTTTWATQLFPRDTGRFTIPAFTIDGQSSQAFDVLVIPVSNAQGAQARQYYVTAEVDKNEVYLQQQIKYTVKIHLAGEIQRGSLQSPELEGAVIKQLGEDSEYQDIINGVRYRIIERNFAIIPQSSGTYSIDGPIFQGEVLTDSRQGFGFFNRTKAINRTGPRQEIKVKPIPENFSDHWLPSEFVQLNEEWQGDDKNFIVGEPITRTLTLTAAGLVEEQLPEITASYPPQFKTYPDQASTSTVEKDNILFAQRIENIAVIPNQTGVFVLPEVEVSWFNVLTEQIEIASIPARSINVLPAPNSSSQANQTLTQVPSLGDETSPPKLNHSAEQPLAAPIASNTPITNKLDWKHWVLISINLLLLVLVVMLVLTRNRAYKQTPATLVKQASASNHEAAWQQLIISIKANDPKLIQKDLLCWLKLASGYKQNSIIDILESLHQQTLIAEYNLMQASIYGVQKTGNWQASEMLALLTELRTSLKEKQAKTPLQALYP